MEMTYSVVRKWCWAQRVDARNAMTTTRLLARFLDALAFIDTSDTSAPRELFCRQSL
jgi:hypothetical protein